MDLTQLISEIIILALALVCGFFAIRLYLYIKGGELAKSWRYIAGAAFFFALYQLINISAITGYISVQIWVLQLVKILFIIFLTLGFFVYKRTLI
jgi:hypothetical protein